MATKVDKTPTKLEVDDATFQMLVAIISLCDNMTAVKHGGCFDSC